MFLSAFYDLKKQYWHFEYNNNLNKWLEFYSNFKKNKFVILPHLSDLDKKLFQTVLLSIGKDIFLLFYNNKKVEKNIVYLDKIINFVDLKNVYLIGSKWLQLDEYKINKENQGIKYIIYKKNIIKVFTSQKELQLNLNNSNFIKDNRIHFLKFK